MLNDIVFELDNLLGFNVDKTTNVVSITDVNGITNSNYTLETNSLGTFVILVVKK